MANIQFFNQTTISVCPTTQINQLNNDLSHLPIKSLTISHEQINLPDVSSLLDNFEFITLNIISKDYLKYDTTETLQLVNKMKHLKILKTVDYFYNLTEVIVCNIEKLEEIYFLSMHGYAESVHHDEHKSIIFQSNILHCLPENQPSTIKKLFFNCNDFFGGFRCYNAVKLFKFLANSLNEIHFLKADGIYFKDAQWLTTTNLNLKYLELDTCSACQKAYNYICGKEVKFENVKYQSNLHNTLTHLKLFVGRIYDFDQDEIENLDLDFTRMNNLKVCMLYINKVLLFVRQT